MFAFISGIVGPSTEAEEAESGKPKQYSSYFQPTQQPVRETEEVVSMGVVKLWSRYGAFDWMSWKPFQILLLTAVMICRDPLVQ